MGIGSVDFERMKEEFTSADLEGKIEMYVSAEGLTQDQYKQLLMLYPIQELHRLEEALK